nr:YjbH domain-containing protein [Caldovatus aquaticus]
MALLAAAGPGALARAEEVPASGANSGGAGLIEMPNARFRPDGTLEAGAALRRQRRFWFASFQALPWLATTFRIAERLDATRGAGTASDRALDLRLRLWSESDWRPALAVGLQDAIGTGLYAGEYLVASKRWWDLDLTLGIGWGRLGTGADLANPLTGLARGFAERPRSVGEGGTVRIPGFFRGERAALFAGLEWSVPPLPAPWGGELAGLRAKVEWSGDALRDERGGYPARRDPRAAGRARTRLNAGLQWSNDWMDAGLHFVHGTDLLFRLSFRLDPWRPPEAERPPPPRLAPRPAGEGEPAAERVFAALRAAGFRPLAFALAGPDLARIAVEGGRHRTLAQTAGRVLRAVQPHLPARVERLELAWSLLGVEVARIELPRRAFEDAAAGRGSAEEVFAAALLLPAGGDPWPGAARAPAVALEGGIEPQLRLLLGDPQRTLRWEAAGAAGARLSLPAGFALAGGVRQTLAGNLDRGLPSDSRLPHVRSDFARYAREGRTAIPALYLERLWNPAPDWFARATLGYLEPMFAGLSAEVLWRPHEAPFALGLDLAYVAQRDFDQRLGLRRYRVATGHLSLYADLPWWNTYAVVRAGRYLAGDWGATVELGRRFDSGIEVGAFATFTDVPFARFGEGSFDKGIYVRIPLDLFGAETRGRAEALIRPVQRDGGQRLAVDTPLWELAREGRADALRRGTGWFLR